MSCQRFSPFSSPSRKRLSEKVARGIHLGEQRAKKEMAIRLSDRGMELMEIAGILDEKEETVKEWLKKRQMD